MGPKLDPIVAPGLLVAGDLKWSVVITRLELCDLEEGGGPGGGGGKGIPFSHLEVDDARDREDVGVLMALAEAALRAAGAR